MDKDILKWDGQCSKSIQASAILIMFWRYMSFWIMILICLYDSLSGSEVNTLLYFEIALLNSFSKNSFWIVVSLLEISFSKSMFIWWWCAKLNNLIAESLHFFTQFMSFQGSDFLFEISWIFLLKNAHLVFLTIFVMMHMRTNILFLLSIFLDFIFILYFIFIDDEEACDCSHMTYHMMWGHKA